MNRQSIQSFHLYKPDDPYLIYKEIQDIILSIHPDFDFSINDIVFKTVIDLFNGDHPGYRRSNTKYHDLDHTCSTALATVRLMHGAVLSNHRLSAEECRIGLIASFFHDVGFIQTSCDPAGTGAKYTVGHENRSIEFSTHFLQSHGIEQHFITDCGLIITATMLEKSLGSIPFRNDSTRLLAMIVATADLLSQMADRVYLEKLLLLYQEMDEAGIPGFDSVLSLLEKTLSFYDSIKHRMAADLGNADQYMAVHFRDKWALEYDPYQESLQKNINHLNMILEKCKNVFRTNLRRGGILDTLDL